MTRTIAFDPNGWEDYVYWQTQDRKSLKRVDQLIADALRDPFAGIGKPEPLRHILSGAWSRRIDETNRLVYYVTDDHIVILQAREHYWPEIRDSRRTPRWRSFTLAFGAHFVSPNPPARSQSQ